MIQLLENRSRWLLPFVCLIPFALSAFFNKGFLASDEYWTSIIHYIPAQSNSIHTLVSIDDVKSPMQNLPMYVAAQLSLSLAILHPFEQYSFVVLFCGLLNSILLLAGLRYWQRRRQLSSWLLPGFVFYVASPLLFTRPMFEIMSAPWLLWAAIAAWEYDQDPKPGALIAGSSFAAVAFLLRPQTGVCALIFVILPLLHRNWKDVGRICVWGALLLLLSGIPDWLLRGEWHYSLIALVRYNAEHGADYGRQPWYYYFPLLFLLTFAPWWIFHLRQKNYLNTFCRLRSLLLIITLFIFEHMLFAQKFERFLFPIVPILFLITWDFLECSQIWRKGSWRAVSLVAISGFFWILAVLSVPQRNLLDLISYVDKHRDVSQIWSFDEALTWLPDVLADRPKVKINETSSASRDFTTLPCPKFILVRESQQSTAKAWTEGLVPVGSFPTGIIDQLSYRLNREHNIRRAPAILFGCVKPGMDKNETDKN